MKITLYSTMCPKCNILQKKLNAKNIKYEEINDIDAMINKGYLSAPVLEVAMDFETANKWVNAQEGK